MPYMLLILEPVGQREERSQSEGEEVYARMLRFTADLRKRGVLLGVESLTAMGEPAARVQVRSGRARVADGPFAEPPDTVGGFVLLNVSTRDEAVTIAAQCPAAEWATVEVRETGPCNT